MVSRIRDIWSSKIRELVVVFVLINYPTVICRRSIPYLKSTGQCNWQGISHTLGQAEWVKRAETVMFIHMPYELIRRYTEHFKKLISLPDSIQWTIYFQCFDVGRFYWFRRPSSTLAVKVMSLDIHTAYLTNQIIPACKIKYSYIGPN
jgi:hypothetical protein